MQCIGDVFKELATQVNSQQQELDDIESQVGVLCCWLVNRSWCCDGAAVVLADVALFLSLDD